MALDQTVNAVAVDNLKLDGNTSLTSTDTDGNVHINNVCRMAPAMSSY